jgi:hypothetical protein
MRLVFVKVEVVVCVKVEDPNEDIDNVVDGMHMLIDEIIASSQANSLTYGTQLVDSKTLDVDYPGVVDEWTDEQSNAVNDVVEEMFTKDEEGD